MDPATIAGLVSAAGSIGGALVGRPKSDANWRNEALQREFAQMGIQWRVKDAIAAGLHPLYALGGAGATYTPGPIPAGDSLGQGLAQAGQDLSRAVMANADMEAKKDAAELAQKMGEAQINKDNAQAQYYLSLATRERQSPAVGVPTDPSAFANPGVQVNPNFDSRTARDLVQVKPDEVTSWAGNERSLAAGRQVGLRKFLYTGADKKTREIYLPEAKNMSEALEAVSESLGLMMTVLNYNMTHNPNFLNEARGIIPFAGPAHDASELLWDIRRTWNYRQRTPRPVPSTPGLK